MKRCSYQGKKKFATEADAERWQRQRSIIPRRRVYRCPHCRFFHLTTSRAPRTI